ncbi:MAG: hypothetical protein WC523_00660 [Patescibacteria group bacterium]
MKVDDKTLVEEYYNLGSANKVSDKLGIPSSTVSCRLKKLGVLKKWRKEINIDKMAYDYKETQSIRKTAENFDVSAEYVREKLGALGLINKAIRYTCSDDFFSTNIIESFYWAGFLAADGCVKLKDKKYKQLSVGLASKDNLHLYKFKNIIKFDGPISTKMVNEKYIASELCISSDKIFDDLARFHVTQRKSLVLTFPEWLINHPNVNHFMRGYNDGDGSFYVSKPKKGRPVEQLYFSLRGTKEFLTVYKNILERECDIKPNGKKPRLNSGIYTLEYGGNRKVFKIRDFLYQNSNEQIRLDRKYDLAFSEQFTMLPEDFKFSPVIATNIETGQEINFKSIKEAKAAGFTGSAISSCCQGKCKSHKGYTWKYA